MSERAAPFHCPYCGEEDLRPHEVVAEDGEISSPHGTWECRGCMRAFSLKYLGLLRRDRDRYTGPESGPETSSETGPESSKEGSA